MRDLWDVLSALSPHSLSEDYGHILGYFLFVGIVIWALATFVLLPLSLVELATEYPLFCGGSFVVLIFLALFYAIGVYIGVRNE